MIILAITVWLWEEAVNTSVSAELWQQIFVQKLKMTYEFYDLKFGQEFYSSFQRVYRPIVNFQ
jgi:hypothetical protein